ncbi:MAG: hypothetical protein VKK04_21130, partial [Synechococcales bacterium]|nr:hypothetical protein [Synechococcales bacterium]
RIQNPESRIQNPEGGRQKAESRIQNPESRIQSLESNIQNPKSKIQNPFLLTLSARTPVALQEMADRYARHLAAHPDLAMEDVCWTANGGRSHFNHRLAFLAPSLPSLGSLLEVVLAGQPHPQVYRGRSGGASPAVVFVFSDGLPQGAIAAQILDAHPLLRQELDRWQALCGADALAKGDSAIGVLATQYALARLWIAWGIAPKALTGWGIGRIVAACVAGGIGLEDGLRLAIAHDLGRHTAAGADPWQEVRAIAPTLTYHPPVYSLLDGAPGTAGASVLRDGQDWERWLTRPTDSSLVQDLEQSGMDGAIALGTLPEDGWGAIAQTSTRSTATVELPPDHRDPLWLASIGHDGQVWPHLLDALAQLYVQGATIDWRQVQSGGRPVSLPTYPFQRQFFAIQ